MVTYYGGSRCTQLLPAMCSGITPEKPSNKLQMKTRRSSVFDGQAAGSLYEKTQKACICRYSSSSDYEYGVYHDGRMHVHTYAITFYRLRFINDQEATNILHYVYVKQCMDPFFWVAIDYKFVKLTTSFRR